MSEIETTPETTPTLLTPKFAIGDTVYYPSIKRIDEPAGCPDCLDTRKWKVTLPSGLEFEVDCERCQTHNEHIPAYKVMRINPIVISLKIAAIAVATHSERYKRETEPEIKYTDRPGAHSWHFEDKLFASESECTAKAEEMARADEANMLARDTEVQKRHRLNTYGLNQVFAANEVEKRREWELKYEKAVDEIKELKEYPWSIDGFSRHTKDIDAAADAVARHLLNELDEDIPEEWGDQ